jgi:hypothetical protein
MARPSRAARLVAEACCTTIGWQIMDRSSSRPLRCRFELSCTATSGGGLSQA